MNRIPRENLGNVITYNEETKTRVFVCGGGSIVASEYANDAYFVGKMLANTNVAYGQGGEIARNTIMGESWKGYFENGGDSAYFFVREEGAPNLDSAMPLLKGCSYVNDISSLMKAQYFWSDIVIIMPGGTGTFIELLGYIELGYDYEKQKPKVILYNKELENGKHFFDGLLDQINIEKSIGFISSDVISNTFTVVNNLEDLEKEYNELLKEKKNVR